MTAAPTSTQRVYDAVCELHALEQVATREIVAELTGLKMSIIDDRMRALVNDGRLKRVLRGVFVPVEIHPPARCISKTVLSDGSVKLEIGDEVLTLTPREDRALALLQVGAAMQGWALLAWPPHDAPQDHEEAGGPVKEAAGKAAPTLKRNAAGIEKATPKA
ncbi:hypothetical protein [Acidovorax sp. SDU_ACID1]|uniref:hypothetical protein n=1 Tax=Acidovorax sp. SDU_ACID1 TaxID=3136632 RepID=UPI003873032C